MQFQENPAAQMQYVVSNRTAEPITLPTKGKPEVAGLVIAPHSKAVLSKEALEQLAYQEKAGKEIDVEVKYTITNKTARRIGIAYRPSNANIEELLRFNQVTVDGQPGLFVIPPFGQREVTQNVLDRLDYEPWDQRNLIDVQPIRTKTPAEDNTGYLALGCLFWLAALGVPAGLLVPALRASGWFWGALVASAVLVLVVTLVVRRRQRMGAVFNWLWQSLTGVVLVSVAIGLPAIVTYYFGGGSDMLRLDAGGVPSLGLLGRGLQLVFVAIVSLLPALLYFQFERQQAVTLREAFRRDVMLLDPNMQTTDDVEITYGRRLDEVYGTGAEQMRERFLFSPIFISMVLIMLGWMLTLKLLGDAGDIGPDTLYTLLIPHPTALNFAFLGAYLFAINLVFRRYVRGDLGPKAYSHITVRILTAVIVAWAISLLPLFRVGPEAAPTAETGAATLAALAEDPLAGQWTWLLLLFSFGIGILPETGVALIQDYLQNVRWIGNRFPSMREEHPLTNLEGINLYDRARLLEEGIENIENLAHYNLIDLMLNTRVPVQRLVDLTDQAILYLHVGITADPGEAKAQVRNSDLERLRRYGIRTATDLERAYAEAQAAGREADFLGLLDVGAQPPPAVKRLEVILNTLRDDEWMAHVRQWRELSSGTQLTYNLEDFVAQRLSEPPARPAPTQPVPVPAT